MALFSKDLLFQIFFKFFLKMTQVWYCITWNCVSQGVCVHVCVCVCWCVCVLLKWLVFRYTSWCIVHITIPNANNVPPTQYTIHISAAHYFCQRQRGTYRKGMRWNNWESALFRKESGNCETVNTFTLLRHFLCVACIIRQTSLYLCGHVTACDVSPVPTYAVFSVSLCC